MTDSSSAETGRIHFMIGTGRCGSTLLHEMLCRHSNVAFMSNLDDRFGSIGRLAARNGQIYRQLPLRFTQKGRLRFAPSEGYRAMSREVSPIMAMSSRDLIAADATPWLADRSRAFFEERARLQAGTILLHKLTGWPRSGFLHAIFPDARFVNVIRDGRAVANSWLQMPWWGGYRGPEHWHWGELPDEYRELWEQSGRSFVVLAGIAWMMLIDAWEAARVELPEGSWLDVRYEDVLRTPTETTDAVLDFLGTPADEPFADQLSRYRLDPARGSAYRAELGDDNTAELNTIMGAHLTRYGYDV